MMYDSILARSFSRHEQKRLRYGAIICCFILVLFFCSFFQPYLGPLPAACKFYIVYNFSFFFLFIFSPHFTHVYIILLLLFPYVSVNKMLAIKAITNSSDHQNVKSMHEINKWPKINSDHQPSKNASDHLQKNNYTSQNLIHYDSKNVSSNITHDLREENATEKNNNSDNNNNNNSPHYQSENSSNNISQHHEDMGTIVTKNGSTTLNVANSTTSSHDHNIAATLIEEVAMTKKTQPTIICNTEKSRSEYCELETDVRIVGKTYSVFFVTPSQVMEPKNNSSSSWSVRPYARKGDTTAMGSVKKWSISALTNHENVPECTRNHSVPALLFSLGGYVGNNFHEFTDVVIPLFITSRKYNGEVQFLVSDKRIYFMEKYQKLLRALSNYKVMDINDVQNSQQVHCFPSATIGLKRHQKEMTIDPERHSYSMKDFRDFLREAYSLKNEKAIQINDGKERPRLLLITRRRTRAFTNAGEIVKTAKSLGYNVIVAEAISNLQKFAELVNSCDVLMGVHGAGLTNIVFLPENAVFIQILPVGGFEWIATNDFGVPAKNMNLKYLEYKIKNEESTLIKDYPLDHAVFTDPLSIGKQGWDAFKSIYLEKQSVNLDVNRFKSTLVEALHLLHA
ncbi:beta-1,2-xylosyltransferase XYXT1-like [Humulus lupulus]|uniref:beta-1,2-xylosyltransferase XYXT1-like n=1 Tax=Humulus lupulus TaxID=3486 RepID=UPI002B404BB0|nr:beta-1,2-xylosyltransferase XYXT1-like [Humulus lupulus]